MIFRLAAAEVRNRPGRAAFLLAGYTLGVAVMVVLLAVGEAMLRQARNKQLVGGGDLLLVPAGVSTEMLRSGGTGSLFVGIDHARFIQRNLLESPRARAGHGIAAASPLLDGGQVELFRGGRRWKAVAAGELPSRAARAGARPRLLAGEWRDGAQDGGWAAPRQEALLAEIDRFHQPRGAALDSTWAEWHYFNLVLDEQRWLYLTLAVGGRVGVPGAWGGSVLLTVREPSGVHRAATARVAGEQVRFDTASPDLTLGSIGSVRLEGGSYRVHASAGEVRVDLRLDPAARRYFPPTDVGGSTLVSGYVAPALFARASGTVCLPRCEQVSALSAYHDHNWGVWRGVSWEWGSASDSALSLLYGVVRGDSAAPAGMFAYLVDGAGVRGVYRPSALRVEQTQTVREGGTSLTVPRRFSFSDPRRGLRVAVDVSAVHATDQQRASRRWFVQMRGVATVEENGRVIGHLRGFFETYVD